MPWQTAKQLGGASSPPTSTRSKIISLPRGRARRSSSTRATRSRCSWSWARGSMRWVRSRPLRLGGLLGLRDALRADLADPPHDQTLRQTTWGRVWPKRLARHLARAPAGALPKTGDFRSTDGALLPQPADAR
jgi:hypothetical protein